MSRRAIAVAGLLFTAMGSTAILAPAASAAPLKPLCVVLSGDPSGGSQAEGICINLGGIGPRGE